MLRLSKGSALISALFIMTLVAIAATAMATRLQLEIYRARLEQTSDNMLLASQALSFWAIAALINPNNKFLVLNKQGQVLQFPLKFKNFYPNLTVEGGIYDLQAKFNLNNLSDPKESIVFSRFLQNTVAKFSEAQTKDIVLATQDWISPYDSEKGEDPYTAYYASQRPPYGISHLPFQSVSEFRLVKGVSEGLYLSLENSITALPEKTAININTAALNLLKALGNGLTDEQAIEIMNTRGKNGIANLEQANALLVKFNIRPEQITLQSQYFLVVATVHSDKINRRSYFIFKRQLNKEKKIMVQLIANTINTL